MNLKKHPVRNLTAMIKKHYAFSRRNFPRIFALYSKIILQEPFRILENVKYDDAIRNHIPAKDPVFIIGHWRSGTSFLQYLLSRDPQFGYLNKFQVIFPDLFLQSESYLKPLINRIPETLNIIRDARNMSVNLELDSPSEIEIALTCMISPASLHWGHIFPENAWDYFNKYLFLDTANAKEKEQWKQDYQYLIQKISFKNNGKQVLVKSPGNSCRVVNILEMYPGARFIFIHRNPYDVFYSSKKLWNTLLDNLALQNFSERQMELEIIRTYKKLMKRYLLQKQKIPAGQLAEVRFQDFISDPVNELHSVYEQLRLKGFTKARSRINHFLENKEKATSGSYEYEKRVISVINRNWEFAFKQWQYPLITNKQYA
ncbi:MAG: sulfotransferase [Balneolaceae bacterium]